LHTQGILHKDLKLENTIYRVENNHLFQLIDYGFSKMDGQSETQRVSGALPYMAPKSIGKAGGPSSDFYSRGYAVSVTTGAFPYSVDQINALITGLTNTSSRFSLGTEQ
jgi:serine/threonine protein kinase